MREQSFTIYGVAGYQRKIIGNAAQAVQKAASYCDVSPLRHKALVNTLEKNGICSYSYGFDWITIEQDQ